MDHGKPPTVLLRGTEALGSRTILLTGQEASPPIETPVQELLDLPARSSTGKKTPRPAVPMPVLRALFARAGGRCEKCRDRGPLQVHHRRPWSDGGSHHLEDLEARCAACHATATTSPTGRTGMKHDKRLGASAKSGAREKQPIRRPRATGDRLRADWSADLLSGTRRIRERSDSPRAGAEVPGKPGLPADGRDRRFPAG
ncbi:MAG: HNH endonuclease [Armatimonadetes bacterium]|nr:HNH endonuclease [Armatimonadota bacterium]